MCPGGESSLQERQGPAEECPEEGHRNASKGWNSSLVRAD